MSVQSDSAPIVAYERATVIECSSAPVLAVWTSSTARQGVVRASSTAFAPSSAIALTAPSLELTVPCGESEIAFYQDAVAGLAGEGIEDRYRAALFKEGPMDAGVGLLELAVDYGAELSIEVMQRAIRLVAELSLEGGRN